jgi:hypothetical protein
MASRPKKLTSILGPFDILLRILFVTVLIGGVLALLMDDQPWKNLSVGLQGLFRAISYFGRHRVSHSNLPSCHAELDSVLF